MTDREFHAEVLSRLSSIERKLVAAEGRECVSAQRLRTIHNMVCENDHHESLPVRLDRLERTDATQKRVGWMLLSGLLSVAGAALLALFKTK